MRKITFKRISSAIIAFVFVFGMLPAIALPVAGVTLSGSCGNNASWLYDTLTCCLTVRVGNDPNKSTGEMTSIPCKDYKSNIETVTIENGITNIGPHAFSSFSNLKSITIPSSVTSIDDNAFFGCKNLKSIIIPSSVTSIGSSAFYGCSSLTSIYIPENVTSIGSSAFKSCGGIKRVKFSNSSSLICIGSHAFEYCVNLVSIKFPNSVTCIGDSAFSGCESLSDVTFEENSNLASIGVAAFGSCANISSISLPSGVSNISDGAFIGCTGIENIEVELNNTRYKSVYNCLIDVIDKKIVFGCGNSVIPDDCNITTIADHAFMDMDHIDRIIIPEGVKSIEDWAFFHCSGLSQLILPKSVTNIGEYAFSNCISLNKLVYLGTEEEWASVTKGTYWNNEVPVTVKFHTTHNYVDGVCIECWDGAANNYLSGECGEELVWRLNLDTGVFSVSGNGNMKEFFSASGTPWYNYINYVKKVEINRGVTSIGTYAFCDFSKITNVTIPYGVTSIGFRTFWGCSNLETLSIPDTITFIGTHAFLNCEALSTIIYCGTEEKWNAVTKDDEWNMDCSATVQFHNYVDFICTECGNECEHSTVVDEICSICGKDLSVVIGDVNGDELISNADVLMIYRYIYNSALYPLNEVAADVNGDGYVSNADVLKIYRYIYNPTLYPIA